MTNEVSKVYTDIAELLNVARAKTYHVVNSIMVETYWKIGQRIVEEEQAGKSRAEYGTKLIENLSKYLTDTFGKGFSAVYNYGGYNNRNNSYRQTNYDNQGMQRQGSKNRKKAHREDSDAPDEGCFKTKSAARASRCFCIGCRIRHLLCCCEHCFRLLKYHKFSLIIRQECEFVKGKGHTFLQFYEFCEVSCIALLR